MAKRPNNTEAPHDPTGVSVHSAPPVVPSSVPLAQDQLTSPAEVINHAHTGKPPGMSDKRFANGKAFTVACTWRRSGGDLPTPARVEYVYDESEAINRYASARGLSTPDCRFAVTAG